MSMIFTLVGVSLEQAKALRDFPSLSNDLATVAQIDASKAWRHAWLNQLPADKLRIAEEQLKAVEALPGSEEVDDDYESASARLVRFGKIESALSLEKSWHILHYAFTGDIDVTASAGGALLAGEEIGEDVGYGPPRLLDAEQTARFAEALQSFDLKQL
jgi:hypothetical protein